MFSINKIAKPFPPQDENIFFCNGHAKKQRKKPAASIMGRILKNGDKMI